MTYPPVSRVLGLLTAVLIAAASGAQPIPIADGFLAPIGIEADADGSLWIAERGTGADDGQISVLLPDGSVEPFMIGAPSTIGAEDVEGLSHLALVGDDVWFTWSDEGAGIGRLARISRAGWTPGDTPKTLADVSLDVDVAAFSIGNGAPVSNPYGIAPAPDGSVYLTDAAANTLLRYDPVADALSTVAAFPDIPNPSPIGPPFTNAVPTGVVWADGRLYVSTLTGFPFNDGQARVVAVDPDGVAVDHARGLTNLTDVSKDPRDGALAALRFALFRFDPPPPGFVFGTGVATHLGDGSEIAGGLPLATAADHGPDGAMYVTTIIGVVFRVDAAPAALDIEMASPHRIDAPSDSRSRIINDLTVTNTTDAPMEVDVWAAAEVVGTDFFRVVNVGRSGMLAPGESGRVKLRQTLKASGDRTIAYHIYAGDMSVGDAAAGDGAMARETVILRQDGDEAPKTFSDPLTDDGATWGDVPLAPEALTVAPNPTRGRLAVSFDVADAQDVTVTLHDALGREVAMLARGPREQGAHTAEADLSGLAPGVYILRLATSSGATTRRATILR